jgi:hypothetical protein
MERNRVIRLTFAVLTLVLLLAPAVGRAEEAAAPTPKTTEPAAKPAEPAPEAPCPASSTLFMDALGAVGAKKPLDDLGLLIYGYTEGGFTGRLIGGQDPLIARVFDADKPNNLRLQQMKLTIERPIDRTKTFDFGGRTDFLYGTDARFIHAFGLTDHTCHEPEQADLEQLYVQAFVGKGNKDGEGLDITFGKWVTPFGAEVIDAPANLLYSRGLLFNYAIPFTHTGVKANYTFSPQASAYAAVVRGWDNFNDSNDSASFMVGGTLGTRQEVCAGTPRASLALNVITGPEQKDNSRDYRTVVDVVGTYRWTEKLTQVVNFDYGTEENGAGASAAHWSGIAHYVTYCFTDCLSGTVRAEWFQDTNGVRTGIQGNLYEITAGLTIQPLPKHAIFKNFYVRPELRWDFTDHDSAFGGGRDDQLTAGFDLIFKF